MPTTDLGALVYGADGRLKHDVATGHLLYRASGELSVNMTGWMYVGTGNPVPYKPIGDRFGAWPDAAEYPLTRLSQYAFQFLIPRNGGWRQSIDIARVTEGLWRLILLMKPASGETPFIESIWENSKFYGEYQFRSFTASLPTAINICTSMRVEGPMPPIP